MSTSESEFGSFAIGLFVGGLIGAAVGLLFAPQSGEETREQIRTKSVELSEQAVQKADEARVKAEHILADARTKFEEATATLDKRAKELQEQAKAFAEDKQKQLQSLTHKAAPVEPAVEAPVAAEPAEA